LEKLRHALPEPVNSHEEHRLEFHALDVLHVKDTDLSRVAHDASFFAAHDRNVSCRKLVLSRFDNRIDPVISVYKHRDGRQIADSGLDFVNAFREPFTKIASRKILAEERPGIGFFACAWWIGFRPNFCVKERTERIRQLSQSFALPIPNVDVAHLDIYSGRPIQPLYLRQILNAVRRNPLAKIAAREPGAQLGVG